MTVGPCCIALTDALADQFHEIDLAATGLLDEIRPNTTVDLLPDWERVVGLPDECSELASNIAERRAAVLSILVSQPNLNPSSYEAIAEEFGVTITVRELDRTAANAIPNLNTTGGRWRFVWWIDIPSTADVRYFTTLSDVLTPLRDVERNPELECRLRRVAPAHTLVVIDYT